MSKRKANIKAHTTIAAAAWIVSWAWSLAVEGLEYNINGGYLEPYFSSLTAGIFATAFQYLHLTIATRFLMFQRLAIALLIYAVSPVLFLYLQYEDREDFSRSVNYPVTILPPAWFVSEPQAPEVFMEDVSATFVQAATEAEEEVTTEFSADEDDEFELEEDDL